MFYREVGLKRARVRSLITIPDGEFEAFDLLDPARRSPTPEHRLLIAVLARAIIDAIRPPSMGENQRCLVKERAEAIDFFLNCGREPFSFAWICEHISSDGVALQKKVLDLVLRGDAGVLYENYYKHLGLSGHRVH